MAKNIPFIWEKEQEKSFEILKNALTNKSILAIYNPEGYTEVHIDACINGVAGVLMQRQLDGKLHLVSYYSRKTSKEEAKYHSYELEALAIVCMLERFRVYLIGIYFIIKTDCNRLKLLADKRDLNPRIGRWFMKLSEYNYSIEYMSGSHNLVSDALSRGPVETEIEPEVASLHVFSIKNTTDWVAALQRDSAEVALIISKLDEKDGAVVDKYAMEDGRLYRTTKGR